VLANKNDLEGALSVDDLIREMRLAEIGGRVVSVSADGRFTSVLRWGVTAERPRVRRRHKSRTSGVRRRVQTIWNVSLTTQCYSTSNKTKHNLDIVLEWLTQRAH
jgi:ADP-ribosylation factor-like protein 8